MPANQNYERLTSHWASRTLDTSFGLASAAQPRDIYVVNLCDTIRANGRRVAGLQKNVGNVGTPDKELIEKY